MCLPSAAIPCLLSCGQRRCWIKDAKDPFAEDSVACHSCFGTVAAESQQQGVDFHVRMRSF